MTAPITVQQKTDEVQSRETSPDLAKPEIEEIQPQPVTETQTARQVHHQRKPIVPQRKTKSK